MKPTVRNLALSLGAALVLAACGGGDGASDDWTGNGSNVSTPVAHAGTAQSVLVGATVKLNGTGSTGAASYTWTLVSKPDGSSASLSQADTASPSFIADVAGRYEFDLVVSNSAGSSNHSRVLITAGSTDPVAAGPTDIVNALINGWAQLDGSDSTPPAGGDAQGMSYHWTVSDPNGKAVRLYDAYSAKPGFTPTVPGVYLAKLVVKYGRKTSNEFVITVNATHANTQPVAIAGGPYVSQPGQSIKLDGSASQDADGDELEYTWRLSPYISNLPQTAYANVKLENANTATPTFSADIAGSYNLDLYVFDGTSRSSAGRATVTVSSPENVANTPPVAVLRDHYPLGEAELLSASGTSAAYIYFYSDSYDKDGDALTYKWEWGDTPENFTRPDISSYTGRTTVSFRPTSTGTASGVPLLGDYTMYLTVNDGKADSQRVSQTVSVRRGANRRPQAKVTAETSSVMTGIEAWFDGTQSSDPDDGTYGMKYQWRWALKPANSKAELKHANEARASFVPDVPGAYEAELIVYDSAGTPSRISEWTDYPKTATVMAKAKNNPPVARFIGTTPGTLDESEGIYRYPLISNGTKAQDGLACDFSNLKSPKLGWGHTKKMGDVENIIIEATALDPDGDQLYYRLSVEQPSGSNIQPSFSNPVESNRMSLKICNIDVPGDYKFTLQVSDGSELTEVQRLVVRVEPAPADASALLLESLRVEDASGYEEVVGEQDPNNFNTISRLDGRDYALGLGTSPNDMAGRQAFYNDFKNGGTVKYYRLTAVGKDFPITDVSTSVNKFMPSDGQTPAHYSSDFENAASYQPRFEGLPDVIKAGESVVFKLILPPMPPQRAEKPAFWDSDRNFDTYDFNFSFTTPERKRPVTYSTQIYVPLVGWNWGK
ncbi:PKD domain-containing protein [Kerstersia similis]|uniref:PKD domain-containing protein n=1 Tax=Kerstersia similis TaxID=206505 RepID=UPI0039F0B972